MRSFVCFVLLAFSFSLVSQTTIYKVINEDGSISFSDTPSQAGVEVKLSAINTANQLATPKARTTEKEAEEPVNYKLNIESPAPEATIRNNEGRVRVTASMTPSAEGKYYLSLGNEEHTSDSGTFSLSGVPRGEHIYQVSFKDNTGKVIALSEARTLYLHQASVLIRNSIN